MQFNAALARTPRRAASLLGLARAASAAGQPKLAASTAREFLSVWKLADKDRPELAEARQLAARSDPLMKDTTALSLRRDHFRRQW